MCDLTEQLLRLVDHHVVEALHWQLRGKLRTGCVYKIHQLSISSETTDQEKYAALKQDYARLGMKLDDMLVSGISRWNKNNKQGVKIPTSQSMQGAKRAADTQMAVARLQEDRADKRP